jgi:hypothetical protein
MSSYRVSRYAKDRGRIYSRPQGLCQACGKRPASQIHHKLSQTKVYKKLYGDLIHHEKNRQYVCNECGPSHAGSGLVFWTEYEFCKAMGLEPRSESARRRKQREATYKGSV